MAISDVFRTLSDSSYLKNVVDDFFQVVSEIKEEGKILAEEIDEIVHKENAFSLSHQATEEERKTTVDLRKDMEKDFAYKHAALLNARGFTEKWQEIAYDAAVCLEKLCDYLQKEKEENSLYMLCVTTQQNCFRQLVFETPDRLAELAAKLRRLLEEPELPKYQPPAPDQESPLGLTERDARLSATEEYIAAVKRLCHDMDLEISKLTDQGPCFSPSALNEQGLGLLEATLKLINEKTSFDGFAAWTSFSHLSSFNRSADLFSQARLLQEKEQKTLSDLTLLSASLHLLISAALENKPLSTQIHSDLQQAVYMCGKKNEEQAAE